VSGLTPLIGAASSESRSACRLAGCRVDSSSQSLPAPGTVAAVTGTAAGPGRLALARPGADSPPVRVDVTQVVGRPDQERDTSQDRQVLGQPGKRRDHRQHSEQ
jgi:hypothetical protein